jgi:RNA polymerase sigma-70 factor (ECF subfamily)
MTNPNLDSIRARVLRRMELPTDAIDPSEIENLLEGLSEASLVVLRMRYVDDLSYAEIAEALDIPLGTVKSRIAYGIRVLRGRRSKPD